MTTASEKTKAAVAELMGACGTGTLVAKLRACTEALWAVCHDENMDRQEMLNTMCLVSGVACAVMMDAAKLLEEE